ncbi:hypothetical protein HMPREF0063_11391 [Aeromicrobium marinum DSM 15272]|uniref:DUF1772 domain-containing protein n=1 Tax=Aeromicrobium marinum DSM 15272 TaxID=585531 RepID=E2SBI2_9ACTN|nr:anthrone oxygenase family protein [Aeromicrobium marinum]EFQ83728.1 hypothetical protein HMPREF0063_11391 [Aeromicrobium marinum DSM 15272]
MTSTAEIALVAGTAGAALNAGVFLGFQVAVMPALRGAADRTFVEAMRRVNVAIVNPVFLLVFADPVPALGVASVATGGDRWVVAALVLHLVTVGITAGVNVPLNDRLAAAGAVHDAAELSRVRSAFEPRWVAAHHVRTATAVLAAVAGLVGLATAG